MDTAAKFIRTVLRRTKKDNISMEFIQLTLTVKVPLMFSVTKPETKGDGQYSKGNKATPSTSTETRLTTRMVLEIYLKIFGSGWTKCIA